MLTKIMAITDIKTRYLKTALEQKIIFVYFVCLKTRLDSQDIRFGSAALAKSTAQARGYSLGNLPRMCSLRREHPLWRIAKKTAIIGAKFR